MTNTKILEMLNNGEIEALKSIIMDEVYKDSLKGNADAKKRYTAMKRYFKYANKNNKVTSLPCKDVYIDGENYNCFCDGYSFVLTPESIGDMENFDKTENEYMNIQKMVDFSGDTEELDLNNVLAESKANGYKFKKDEIGTSDNFQHAFKFRDGYYKIGILDQAYSIINDGEKAEVTYKNGKALLIIKTSIGICAILPFNGNESTENQKKVVMVESKYESL